MSDRQRTQAGGRDGGGAGEEQAGPATWVVGRNAVEELLERAVDGAGGPVEKVLVALDPAASRWWGSRGRELVRSAGVVVQRVPRETLDRLAPGVAHQGIAARVAAAPLLALEDVLSAQPPPTLLLLLDGVEDPRNMGAIVRSAAAAGADAVLLPERRSAPVGPAAAKAAVGALERIPLARVKNVQRALEALSDAGVWTLGLDTSGPSAWDADLARPTCLVVGSEERGLSRLARERCDGLVSFPLMRGVESLNVSVACALALYEALRQRRPMGSGAGNR